MRDEGPKQRASVTFQCRGCRLTWEAAPARIEDAPEQEHHPWRYFATCANCGSEVKQAPWERALLKAWVNATGPKTPEGIAATSKNLEGHPTPEEAKRTRFNGMKHGMSARVATYFPAKPDGYAFCNGCEVSRSWCAAQVACTKKTELFMLHHAAFEQRDPKRLMGVYSELQSALFAVLQQVLQTIIADGVKIVAPQYYTDKDGTLIIADYYDDKTGEKKTIWDIQAHPLFKPLGELLSRVGLTLADMGMTTKVIEQDEGELGKLAGDQSGQEALTEYQKRQQAVLEQLAGAIERGREKTASDPVLIEYSQASGEAKTVSLTPGPSASPSVFPDPGGRGEVPA